MSEMTALGSDRAPVIWRPMTTAPEPRWHAALSAAVAGTVRGLALVVASSPAPHRRLS